MKSLFRVAALSTLGVTLLGACQMAPLSYLNGNPDRPLPNHEYPVHIVSVDQTSYLTGPVQVAPGKHVITVQLSSSQSRAPSQKTLVLDVMPCTRYYITAKKDSIMESKWEPKVFDSENVGGCNVEDELKKARSSSVVVASRS
ncbi:hypothetical protein [Undibacterium umbellatum]|jgi:hypothetical protein|uniref:Lipoprotein n=1 Tax=Undibacterium umbellatum TaxID=2762300 RepID=A0ABR6Z796_9BURK|nr:hypothetical protein [Undibacterium umbellatum]MBC3907201.1 hypothetical protein [Undibacterium umbellatum]